MTSPGDVMEVVAVGGAVVGMAASTTTGGIIFWAIVLLILEATLGGAKDGFL